MTLLAFWWCLLCDCEVRFLQMAADPFDAQSPLFWVLVDDDSDNDYVDIDMDEMKDFDKPTPGRGNAMIGYRDQYHLYAPSSVFPELSVKEDVWKGHIPFKPNDFLEICNELYQYWRLPRAGYRISGRKHGIESSLFGTISILRTANTLINIESTIKVDQALIDIDFQRNLELMSDHLSYEITWPDQHERLLLCGFNDFFNSPLILDCTDCPMQQQHDPYLAQMLYSWKCTQAYRNMVVIDNLMFIRACASVPAGCVILALPP